MGKSVDSKMVSDIKPLLINENKSKKCASVMIFLAFCQMFVSSGIILGWQSLANIIKSNGTYRFICEDPSLPCIEEEIYLANLMSISLSIQMFSVLFLGIFMDLIGPKFMAVCQFISAIGTFMIATGDPKGSIDYIWYGAILQNLCGCIYIPSFIHLSNLYPNRRAIIASTFSTLYGFSSFTFLIVQLIHDHFSLSLTNVLLPLAIIQALFVFFSLLLPNKTIHVGDRCGFSLKKCGFYVMEDTIKDEYSHQLNTKFEIGDKGLGSFIKARFKPLFNYVFSKMFVVQFLLELFVVVSVNFYVSTLSLQIEELSNTSSSEERKTIGYFWSTIFTFIAPLGSLIGVLEGYLVDKYGLWKSALVPAILLIACSTFKLIPNIPFQILTFITYTTSQEAVFSSAYSLFTLIIPADIICTFAGVNLLLQAFPAGYLPQCLIKLFSQYNWTFRKINFMLIIPTVAFSAIYVKFLSELENKKLNKSLQSNGEDVV